MESCVERCHNNPSTTRDWLQQNTPRPDVSHHELPLRAHEAVQKRKFGMHCHIRCTDMRNNSLQTLKKKKNGLSTCRNKTTMKGRCSTDTNRANHKTSSVSYVLHTPVQLCYQIRMCVSVCVWVCLWMTATHSNQMICLSFFFLQGRSSHPTICFDGNQGVRRTG